MQNATHRISLDIHDIASQAVISVKKGDSKRKIVAIFTEDGKPYPIDADCTAAMRFKKPDGTVVYSACSVGFSGVVCDLTTQATAAVGSVGCEITLYGADKKQITSPRFEMIVDDTLYADFEAESSNEFTALTQAMAQFGGVSGATQRAEAAAKTAVTAKENASESARIALISQETAQTAAATAIEKAAAGRMEVIYSTTLTEEVNDITVSTLPNGDSFSLDRVAIYMQLPTAITIKINELTVWFNEQTNSNRVFLQAAASVGLRNFYFIGERIGNDDISVWDCCSSIGSAASGLSNPRKLVNLGTAGSILINSVNNLPVGTQVLICGRKASQ